MKKNPLIAVFLLALVSWIGNLWVYEKNQLPEPVFLSHFIDLPLEKGASFKLSYLENHRGLHIVDVQVPGLPYASVNFLNKNRYTYQNYQSVLISLEQQIQETEPPAAPVQIKQVRAWLNDGSSRMLDIGHVTLTPPARTTADRSLFESSSGGTSNQNAGYTLKTTKEDLILTGMDNSYPDDSLPRMKLYLDTLSLEQEPGYRSSLRSGDMVDVEGLPIEDISFPLAIQKGNYVRLSYRLEDTGTESPEHKAAETYNRIEKAVRLNAQTSDGFKDDMTLFINHESDLSASSIRTIVQARRELP
ncbi:hypothetical protein [Paenibacillus sp. UNC499MF]|uniref:hypothetical protein n=1 Tax=Paenibacillus sp. UNC499MF TaxID=1502751 RepID=UPI0008A00F55|nr:hypothetical protein [Paenibacillus sp. UNC499MF]SEG29591.1 hypothetical protein SAMN02799616_02501 [Paenibacillus sp. UNC499MF]